MDNVDLKSMVKTFRVAELQALLAFAGKNKSGRKNELLQRALDVIQVKSPELVMKVEELHRMTKQNNFQNRQPFSINMGSSASQFLQAISIPSDNDSSKSDENVLKDLPNIFGHTIMYLDGKSGDEKDVTVTVPIGPDVRMKEVPFYETLGIITRPTSLINQDYQSKKQRCSSFSHSFCLSESEVQEILNSRRFTTAVPTVQYWVQVQLRFCALDSSEEQTDLFPKGLALKVNNRPVQLPPMKESNRPGVQPTRPSKPIDITDKINFYPVSENKVHVSWTTDPARNYCMLINMVKKLSANELFARLKAKRIQPPDFTRGRIKEIIASEEEDLCAPTSIKVTVACPLVKSRIIYPCRAVTCKHLQCFDAYSFLLMNEKKPSFICPVCNKHLKFGDLCIDGYFMDVLRNLSKDAGNEIELFPDGSWLPAVQVKSKLDPHPPKRMKCEPISPPAPAEKKVNETIKLDDDISVLKECDFNLQASSDFLLKTSNPVVVDLDSSDDEGNVALQKGYAKVPEKTTTGNAGSDDDASDVGIGLRHKSRKAKTNVSYVGMSLSDSDSDSSTVSNISVPAVGVRQINSPTVIDLSRSDSDSCSSTSEETVNSNQEQTAQTPCSVDGESSTTEQALLTKASDVTVSGFYVGMGQGTEDIQVID